MPLSLARIEEIQGENFADDVEIEFETMQHWTEEELAAFFVSGDVPPPSRPLRVLSLHGGGTNKKVNSMQLARLKRALGPPEAAAVDYFEGSRVWKDEEVSPFIMKMFGPGPYFGFYGVENDRGALTGTPEYMEALMDPSASFVYLEYDSALDKLEAYMAANGPYDVLIGFSMGAIMITMLTARTLQRAAKGECAPPTWRCNVLLSALPPRASPYATVAPRWRATREFPVSACRGAP